MLLNDFSSGFEEIAPNSILFTAVLKPKIDFVQEIISKPKETDVEVTKIESILKISKSKTEFLENLDLLSVETVIQIEVCSRSQCCNEKCYVCH